MQNLPEYNFIPNFNTPQGNFNPEVGPEFQYIEPDFNLPTMGNQITLLNTDSDSDDDADDEREEDDGGNFSHIFKYGYKIVLIILLIVILFYVYKTHSELVNMYQEI